MNFDFFIERYSHDKILVAALNDPSLSKYEKALRFCDRFGDDKMLFEQLSVKRPDDPMKYALEYWDKYSGQLMALNKDPSFKNAIDLLGTVSSIVGKEKINLIAHLLYKNIVEMRETRAMGETIVKINEKDGSFTFDQGNYIGDIPGRKVVPDIVGYEVTLGDMIRGHGTVSKASLNGNVNAVDDEFKLRAGREAMKAAKLFTDEFYKNLVDEERKEKRKVRNIHKPLISDMWNFLTGKKMIEYLSVEVLNIPSEMFWEVLVGGGIEFAEIWWKYFNGSGGNH